MAEIALINQMINALSVGIKGLYPDIDIFDEEVSETLPSKSFIIGIAGDIDTAKQPNNRFKISGTFDITYISQNNKMELMAEYNRVRLTIAINLGVIEYQGLKIRLSNYKSMTSNDELHITADFYMFIHAEDETPQINNVTVRT